MTVTSDVAICNAALASIGQSALSSLDEPSATARLARARFGPLRDAVLRAHPWNFAMARARLAPLATAPAFGFARAYQLPAECLRVLEAGVADAAWRVEGRRLLTDQPGPLDLLFVARVERAADYDALFVEALAARLAADLAVRLTENASRAAALWDLYQAKMREARMVDAREGTADLLPEGTWLEARR